MPKFTTEFKVFVLGVLLVLALGVLFYSQFALSESVQGVNERVESLEYQGSVTVAPEVTASPSATTVPTKVPLRVVTNTPTPSN